MIILNMRTRQWALLNIMKMTISDFPDFLEDASIVDLPIWHPDSQHITVTFSGGGDGSTEIASLDYQTHSLETLFAFEESGAAVAWLSPTELLYVAEGNWLIWNTDSQESTPFGTELFPQYWALPADDTILHITQRAPNFEYATRYYSPRSYDYALWQESFDGMSKEEFNELNERVRIPGFDLFDLNAGTNKHIDVNSEFLLSLEWSPSSSRIVVSTYPDSTDDTGNIYTYDLDTETLKQVGDFPALVDTEYGPYVPTWSSNEQWLAINTRDGYIAYNLLTEEVIELNDGYANGYMSEFTHTNMRLAWSPIMDYSAADCS